MILANALQLTLLDKELNTSKQRKKTISETQQTSNPIKQNYND
jgi:hypothetical protein